MDVRLHPLEYTQRDLPKVCAVTGDPAGWGLTLEARRPVNPAWFLLILFGPIGWLVLLFVLTRSDGTTLDIPVSQQVMDAIREKRRRWWVLLATFAVGIGVMIGLNDVLSYPAAFLALVPALVVGIWVGTVRTHRLHLRLDAAGLVTVRNVHPAFAAALEQWRREVMPATPQPGPGQA